MIKLISLKYLRLNCKILNFGDKKYNSTLCKKTFTIIIIIIIEKVHLPLLEMACRLAIFIISPPLWQYPNFILFFYKIIVLIHKTGCHSSTNDPSFIVVILSISFGSFSLKSWTASTQLPLNIHEHRGLLSLPSVAWFLFLSTMIFFLLNLHVRDVHHFSFNRGDG